MRREAVRAACYAKRFAAKEACAKALGTGHRRGGRSGATWAVVNLETGQPTLELSGGAARTALPSSRRRA